MMDAASQVRIEGACPCGEVQFHVDGRPRVHVICHCPSCQKAHCAPLVRGAQVARERFTLLGDVEAFRVSAAPDATWRHACRRCGARIFNGAGDFPRTIFPELCASDDWFEPQMHLYWSNRRVEVVDSLPKYLDFPIEFGGSGRLA